MKLNKKLLEAKEKEEESRLEWQLQVILKSSVAVSGNDRKTAKCKKKSMKATGYKVIKKRYQKHTQMKVTGNKRNLM